MYSLMKKIDGNKTYVVALAMAAYAGLGLWLGNMDQAAATEILMQAAGLAGLRHAVDKV